MSDVPAGHSGTGKRPSELATRTLTGLGLVALALVALAFGGFPFWLLAVVAGVFMMAEWSALHGADGCWCQPPLSPIHLLEILQS